MGVLAKRRRARDVADQLYDLHHCRRQKVILEGGRLAHSVMLLFTLLPRAMVFSETRIAPVLLPQDRETLPPPIGPATRRARLASAGQHLIAYSRQSDIS